jgi:hypothetical protein
VAPSAQGLQCPERGSCMGSQDLVEPCLDMFSHEPDTHCDPHPHAHPAPLTHCESPSHDTRLEMEWLKTYRFKCYQCINPTCSANALALQAYRSNLNYASGNIVTSMTYGATGSTRTTTTTTTMTTTAV